MSVVLARDTDNGVLSFEIDLSASKSMMITARFDDVPANFEILTFNSEADRDAGFNQLVTGLDGDGYVLID